MPEIDFFHFFRLGVGWIATIYATLTTIQSLYGWYVYLSSGDRYTSLMRRYLLVQAVRLRFRAFAGDLLVCLLLCILFLIIWRAHYPIWQIESIWRDVQRTAQAD
ncbi:MAG: hypothetical protein NZ561_10635 [Phycisphaerae bacterium]|nr:hypothetical protein [Phycisphaerae bacterium]MDW8261768.1 hypothetical protein [Phycisphaerales bacterium]